MSRLFIFFLVFLGAPLVGGAPIYQWKDENGAVHFSDREQKGATTVTPKETTIFQSEKQKPPIQRYSDNSAIFIYYDIYPSSLRDLRRAAFSATPILTNGKPFLGLANWNVKWSYHVKQVLGECWIHSVSTQVSITYTMPRLGNRSTLPREVSQAFDRYYASLLLHEEGHGNHGRQAAQEIEELLLRIPRQKSCSVLDPIANMRSRGVFAKYRELDRQYDSDTGHGRTQGADIANYLR